MTFLSPAYLAELGARLAESPVADDGPRVGIGQLIPDAPGGEVAYTVLVGGGAPSALVVGSLEQATVTLVIDFETAQDLREHGEITAALGAGRIKVRGDVSALVRAYPLIQDALSSRDEP